MPNMQRQLPIGLLHCDYMNIGGKIDEVYFVVSRKLDYMYQFTDRQTIKPFSVSGPWA